MQVSYQSLVVSPPSGYSTALTHQNEAVDSQNEAVESQNEAVDFRNEAVKSGK